MDSVYAVTTRIVSHD